MPGVEVRHTACAGTVTKTAADAAAQVSAPVKANFVLNIGQKNDEKMNSLNLAHNKFNFGFWRVMWPKNVMVYAQSQPGYLSWGVA